MSLNNNSKNKQSDQSSLSDLWLIKLESEQVKGPFTTEAICKMILEGIYSGQEYVARYPEGDWRPVSKQAEFYETLLESLENPIELGLAAQSKNERWPRISLEACFRS